jgi:hypothetical protein
MFVLCVLYSKDKRHSQDNQGKEVVQMKYREQKKIIYIYIYIPMGARFSAPVQTFPGAHPVSCTMGTGSFPGVKRSGRGLNLHSLF